MRAWFAQRLATPDSIAHELNTGLLGDPTVAAVVKNALGFTLYDIRAIREASVVRFQAGSSRKVLACAFCTEYR
jgi:hypothetical protein